RPMGLPGTLTRLSHPGNLAPVPQLLQPHGGVTSGRQYRHMTPDFGLQSATPEPEPVVRPAPASLPSFKAQPATNQGSRGDYAAPVSPELRYPPLVFPRGHLPPGRSPAMLSPTAGENPAPFSFTLTVQWRHRYPRPQRGR
ncbi:MAG: hypothetical protein HC922_09665, partial [Leptolyngbyaceae cyanobacterium SM2_3_12]|nr:hypothetical protein [Leptolyngbyaceae cyanobacterium SM2_3_12]